MTNGGTLTSSVTPEATAPISYNPSSSSRRGMRGRTRVPNRVTANGAGKERGQAVRDTHCKRGRSDRRKLTPHTRWSRATATQDTRCKLSASNESYAAKRNLILEGSARAQASTWAMR
ncbi:hypothetical protein C8034_v008322 [Colletotrichum sidae]|uniref:Uncharacterized protein n=1 Tax=Colletotrichum sidae TaxID=1347389 RepID=A0A4R8TR90_9PEZI|nr:hypothetical protein C8034_v008322 [Colletotrichum sidae]